MARKLTRKAKSAINKRKFRESQKRSRKSSTRKSGKRKSRKSKRKLSRKDWVARRIQTSHDYVALKKYRKANYGPIPFEMQPSWLRAKQGKKYRAKRARWAKARSSR